MRSISRDAPATARRVLRRQAPPGCCTPSGYGRATPGLFVAAFAFVFAALVGLLRLRLFRLLDRRRVAVSGRGVSVAGAFLVLFLLGEARDADDLLALFEGDEADAHRGASRRADVGDLHADDLA